MTMHIRLRFASLFALPLALALTSGQGCSSPPKSKNNDKEVAAARRALAVAASPRQRSVAAAALGFALLQQPDPRARTEALALFRAQVSGSGGTQGQGGLLSALLALHRDQEAARILQSLRKQGKSEDDIRQQILFGVYYVGPYEPSQIDDFNERLLRLDPNSPLQVGGRLIRPETVYEVTPTVTDEARRHNVPGTVILETIIDTQGRVRVVKVLKGQPIGLTQAAVEAVNAWSFRPATLDGDPVTIRYVITVSFKGC